MCWVMGLLMLPLRVVGWRLCCLLSSQRICEDVLSVDAPQAFSLVGGPRAGLCRLCGFLCWSGFYREDRLLKKLGQLICVGEMYVVILVLLL